MGSKNIVVIKRFLTEKIKWNTPDLGKDTEDSIDDFENLLEIIEINDLNQISDMKAVMKENEIVEIVDVSEIISENNYTEIEYTNKEGTKSYSDNFPSFLWNKIKEFSNYYNS